MKKIAFVSKVFFIGMMILSIWQPIKAQAQERELYREGHFLWTIARKIELDGQGQVQVLSYAMIVDYTGPGGSLQIPSTLGGIPVVVILDEAFFKKGLTSVLIPDTIIGFKTSNLDIPAIGTRAFDSNQLTSISLPNGITSIGAEAFAGNQLTSITIPNGVTRIGGYAFAENRLTRVDIPNSVTRIEEGAFAGNLLTNVNIPNSVTHIGVGAFAVNRLTSVSVPSDAYIGEKAFARNGVNSDRDASITRR